MEKLLATFMKKFLQKTIGTSGYPYVEAFPSQSLESWIIAHINAFRYYGGV